MTWTWSDSDLSTALSQVRQTIGDTQENNQLLSDEMIDWRLGQTTADDVKAASIGCVQDIIAKLARDYDRSNVGMSVSRSQQIQHYRDLLGDLIEESGGNLAAASAAPFLGGSSDAEQQTIDSDTDYKQNQFRVGQDSQIEPGGSSYDTDPVND